jgi:phage-related protein
MTQWQIEFYQSPSGNPVVLDWFLQQEPKVQARFAQIFDLLQAQGTSVGMPYVRSLVKTELYEIRVKQNTNIYRLLYFAHTGKRFILLHGFQKKTQRTPKKEIELAQQRRKEFLRQETE